MAITKELLQDQITVTANGVVQLRYTTKIMEDGNEISSSFHRTTLIPGQDVSDCSAEIISICNIMWTPQVVASYLDKHPT